MMKALKKASLKTPLGVMTAIADDAVLYLLEFEDCYGLEREEQRLQQGTKTMVTLGRTAPIDMIEGELNEYFEGKLTEFKTPLLLLGSAFQKRVWEELRKIPHGQTRSYGEIAKSLGKPTAFRAVAQANGANQLAIIIPCHRVINANGALGGYAGGLTRKQWLLHHEKRRR